MWSFRCIRISPVLMPVSAESRQSSISTTGYLDGLGRRSIRFDREFGATLECLHVRPELRAYEDALLSQACAISELGEAQVVRIRSLEREQGRLVVISELPRGDRLSDVFDSRSAGAASTIEATFGFLLQVLPTLSALHRASVVHGAIAPGRVMVDSTGRVVLADAIFGTALPRLNLSSERLWHELQIAFAPGHGLAGAAADVAQAALCSIAVVVGRQLESEDPHQALPAMIEHVAELAHARGGDRLSKDVRTLFRSLLPVPGGASQATAAEALDNVREIANRDLDQDACAAAFAQFVRYEATATVIATFDAARAEIEPIDSVGAEDAADAASEPVPVRPAAPLSVPATEYTPTRSMFGLGPDGEALDVVGIASFTERGRALLAAAPFPWKIAAAAVLVVGFGVFAARSFMQGDGGTVNASTSPAPAAAAPVPGSLDSASGSSGTATTGGLSVNSQPAGARVLIDGVKSGHTPLRLDSVAPGRHIVTTILGGVSTKRTVRVEAGKTAVVDIAGVSAEQTGWVTIKSPVRLDVAEAGRQLGTSDQPRIQLAPGTHSITLSNRTVAYSSVHTVRVTAAEEAVLTVAPTGRVNLNAQPWAEVWIDGTRAGETPLANLQVLLGSREFVFKHPQHGERKLTATVSTNPIALTVDFTKPSQRP
jgi:hypothetical protein